MKMNSATLLMTIAIFNVKNALATSPPPLYIKEFQYENEGCTGKLENIVTLQSGICFNPSKNGIVSMEHDGFRTNSYLGICGANGNMILKSYITNDCSGISYVYKSNLPNNTCTSVTERRCVANGKIGFEDFLAKASSSSSLSRTQQTSTSETPSKSSSTSNSSSASSTATKTSSTTNSSSASTSSPSATASATNKNSNTLSHEKDTSYYNINDEGKSNIHSGSSMLEFGLAGIVLLLVSVF